MRNEDIYSIASNFRSAILEAKYNREFNSRDRMSNFPSGCCDDSCDLLAYYLDTTYNIHTRQRNGRYCDNDFYNTTNHVWLVMDEDTIIDITGDQFRFCTEYAKEVYVGKENSFYKKLEDKRIDENCDITQNIRLWNDYQIIMSYMPDNLL